MPSQLRRDVVEHDEITVMNHNAPVKMSLPQHQASKLSNEKVPFPGENRGMRLHEKSPPLKLGISTEPTDLDQHATSAGKIDAGKSVPFMPLGNRHKPWPSRKVTGVEEVVKYMTSVPSYLQLMEKGDSVREKALNFGVLDWGRLEKWTYLQKQVANRRDGDTPSSSNVSSPSFSTFGSSSQSDRSIDSSFAQRKQSPTLDAHRKSPAEGRRFKMTDKQNPALVMGNPDTRTSHSNTSIGHNHEKYNYYSDVGGISRDKFQPPPDIGSFPCTSKDNYTPAFAHNKLKTQIGRSNEAESFQTSEQSFHGNLHSAKNLVQDQFSVFEGMWDHLQESDHARRISYDSSTLNNGSTAEVRRNSFAGYFAPSDIQFTSPPPQIPYSCPFPSTSQSDEPPVASTPLSENKVLTAKGKHVNLGRFTESLSEKFVANMADKSCQGEVAAAPRRESSPHRLLRVGLNRLRSSSWREGSSGQQMKQTSISENTQEDNSASNSRSKRSSSPHRLLSAGLNRIRNSSLREGSPGKQMKQTICSDHSQEENAASNSRSRRSPLRRIFDPLLKSKNHIHFSGPVTSLSSHQAQEVINRDMLPIRDELKLGNEPCKSSDASINPSSRQVIEAGCSLQAENQVKLTRQALLKLSWKNGLPLFVLSSSGNILAATMGKRSISQKNDFECFYTIFTAHELKQRGGGRLSQGNKSKKHDLSYNVVGQMRVSSSKSTGYDSKNYLFMKEFVLFGAELTLTTQKCVSSLLNSELAAIVIQVQNERPEIYKSDLLESNNCIESSHINSAETKCSKESLQIEQKTENLSLASIVAILPSGVHAISSTGQPSPLIERWKSGGSCDCGGWDEGCMLTVLTDKIQDNRSSISAQASTADGTHRIELFTQGEARENKHAFSMIAFKEGVYTVEFGASITLLQAFAMCIAILHNRKPTTLSGIHYSMEAQGLQDHVFADYTRITNTINQVGDPTSYIPYHPPISPVQRA